MSKKFIGHFDLSMIQNMEEFDKRYFESFMRVDTVEGASDIFLYIGSDGGFCTFRNDVWGDIKLKRNTEHKVFPIFPKVGLFNFQQKAVFTCRVPVRQNRRSVSVKNVKFEDPVMNHFCSTRKYLGVEFKILRASINPTYPKNITEGISILKTNDIQSVALSPEYMVSWGPSEKDLSLWYKSVPVGLINENSIVMDQHYFQEMKDYVRDNREPFVVEKL